MKPLFSLLCLCALLSGCIASVRSLPPSSAPINQMSTRSDEGLRKGVLELRKVRFQKWDKDHNGFLTREEVSDEQMVLPGVISSFQDYDTNRDGKIYLEEFLREDTIRYWMALIRPKIDELFSKHDRDGNRLITRDENAKIKLFFSPWPHLKGGDLNQDGMITFSEFEDAYMEVLPFFQQPVERAELPTL